MEYQEEFNIHLWDKFNITEQRAMRKELLMTQELFDSIIQRCENIGAAADDIFYQMLAKYPDYMEVNADRIEEEYLKEPVKDLPEFDTESMWLDLLKKIEEEEKKPPKKRIRYVL